MNQKWTELASLSPIGLKNSYLILLLSVFLVYRFVYKLLPGKAVNAADFFNLGMSGLYFLITISIMYYNLIVYPL